MGRHRIGRRMVLSLLGVSLCLPQMAIGLFGIADLVHDPIQNATNTLTAIRSLASNVNEVRQINNQITSLANEARQLASLPLSLVADIQRTMSVYTGLLNQGKAIAYDVKNSISAFDALFSTGNMPFLQRSQAILEQIRQAGRLSTEVESIYEQLCATTSMVEQLSHASQAAIGELQATQAGNQLLAVHASQLNGIYQLQATTSRLNTIVTMHEMVSNEQARANAQQWMAGYPLHPATWQRGRGVELPR